MHRDDATPRERHGKVPSEGVRGRGRLRSQPRYEQEKNGQSSTEQGRRREEKLLLGRFGEVLFEEVDFEPLA